MKPTAVWVRKHLSDMFHTVHARAKFWFISDGIHFFKLICCVL